MKPQDDPVRKALVARLEHAATEIRDAAQDQGAALGRLSDDQVRRLINIADELVDAAYAVAIDDPSGWEMAPPLHASGQRTGKTL